MTTTTTTVIRYRTSPDRADENQRDVEGVFAQLATAAPAGVRYLTLRLPDATFLHVVMYENGADSRALTDLPAFQTFQAGLRERRLEPPARSEATLVGSYRMVDR